MNLCKLTQNEGMNERKERRVRKERDKRGRDERERERREREKRKGERDHDKLHLPARCSPTGGHRAVVVSGVLPLAGLGAHLPLFPDLPAKV